MPQIGKEALSQFIRTECLRQLRLNLSPDTQAFRQERAAAGMPPVQPPRPGLEHLAQAGEEWQAEKLADLSDTFGAQVVVGDRYTTPSGAERWHLRDGSLIMGWPTGMSLFPTQLFGLDPMRRLVS